MLVKHDTNDLASSSALSARAEKGRDVGRGGEGNDAQLSARGHPAPRKIHPGETSSEKGSLGRERERTGMKVREGWANTHSCLHVATLHLDKFPKLGSSFTIIEDVSSHHHYQPTEQPFARSLGGPFLPGVLARIRVRTECRQRERACLLPSFERCAQSGLEEVGIVER